MIAQIHEVGYSIIGVPLFINLSSTKKFPLNLNHFRNANYFTINKAKQLFNENFYSVLKGLPTYNKVEITYTIFAGSKAKFDLANIGSILDKFFCDALQIYNLIPDDNYEHIIKVTFVFGGLDLRNPHANIVVNSLD